MVQEASFTFTTPLNVNLVEIKGVEHLFVEGDISTNDIDLVNDSMTKACQESMQRQILERNMKLDLEHEAFKGESHEEKEINKTKIPAGKLIDATVKDLGKDRFSTRVKGEINVHNPNYQMIKGNLMDSYLDAFSVAFLPTAIAHEEREGKTIRLLNDVKLLNVALTGNPCNTKAQLTEIFTKSMDAVEEYKKLKELDPSIESQLVVKNKKSHSTGFAGRKQLNENQNSKMTDDEPNKDVDPVDAAAADGEGAKPDADNGEGADSGDSNESGDAEQKALFKSMSEEMKALAEKYDSVSKENVAMKEDMKAISSNLAKIAEALENPIHKSQGVQKSDAESKAKNDALGKSVDPLSLF